jgi:hypothetical protein
VVAGDFVAVEKAQPMAVPFLSYGDGDDGNLEQIPCGNDNKKDCGGIQDSG